MNHGQTERYKHECIGINGRIDTIQAAVLRVKLKYFAEEIGVRRLIAQRYDRLLLNSKLATPIIRSDRNSVYAQYSVRSPERTALIEHLAVREVPTAIHYPIPLYRQKALKNALYVPEEYPVTERVTEEILSLPMSAYLTEEQQDYIVTVISDF
jgi:UDP-2-acetamido-2-deoxy-ribo-hexuluronate aminotransferase